MSKELFHFNLSLKLEDSLSYQEVVYFTRQDNNIKQILIQFPDSYSCGGKSKAPVWWNIVN